MAFPTTSMRARIGAVAVAASLLAGACGSASSDPPAQGADPIAAGQAIDGTDVELASTTQTSSGSSLFDSSFVHDIEVTFDPDAYDAMIATYETTGDKDWIEATVTIDGTSFDNVGIRLKGNSSLFSLSTATAGNPEDLPWLIALDKYVDGQSHLGVTDVVIRSNSTETAMNEAVALELLGAAGLATEEAIATSFTVNGGETELRLAIEHPDEIWDEGNFGSDDAALYKADSEGDYSYRGDDPEAYDDVFGQKAGDDDLEPLIDFLEFINTSDDAAFADQIGDWLDIESFATYLAFQDLIGNFDDIDGPGNNSYLHYDYETAQFTVVSWDLNLAFGTANVNGGGPGGAGGPGAVGAAAGPGRAGGGGPGAPGDNVLSSRFLSVDAFAAMVDEATVELTASLFTSGVADAVVTTWTDTLSVEAGDLVDVATIESDAAAIVATFPTS